MQKNQQSVSKFINLISSSYLNQIRIFKVRELCISGGFSIEYLEFVGLSLFEVNFVVNLSAMPFSSSYFLFSCFSHISF